MLPACRSLLFLLLISLVAVIASRETTTLISLDTSASIDGICGPEWILIDSICYLIKYSRSQMWSQSKQECENINASLAIIISAEQNQRLTLAIEDICDPIHTLCTWTGQFFIGLVCLEDGLAWLDGSPLEYSNLDPKYASNCDYFDKDSAYAFMRSGEWAVYSKANSVNALVCSKPAFQVSTARSTILSGDTSTVYGEFTSTVIESSTAEFINSTDTTDPTSTDSSSTSTETSTILTSTVTRHVSPTPNIPIWVIAVMITIGICICGVCLIIIILCRRQNRILKDNILEVEIEKAKTLQTTQKPSNRYYWAPKLADEWEINRQFVDIDFTAKLGEGAFGSVYKGRVFAKNIPMGKGRSIVELTAMLNDSDTVAVKALQETADSLAERDFISEIDLMKTIGYHERLVNILACVTLTEPILLILEYCANGDLLTFMREKRKYMLENNLDIDEDKTVKKQLLFAIQIAYGMEYLSSRGIIHRDIAARNIMVDHLQACKIGDFGLCRAIHENDIYTSRGGKLPMKWMSPEAIEKYDFSVASDAWAYGVLLFEIATLGGTPYAGWHAPDILGRLKMGERMEKPESCSDNLYGVMRSCWAEMPSDRPTFTALRKQLGVLLSELNKDGYYLKLDAHAEYYILESNAS